MATAANADRGSVLTEAEREDFLDWLFRYTAHRARSKRGPQPLVGEHETRCGVRYLRGSDQTERIFAAVRALVLSGCPQKIACIMVATNRYLDLGRSNRGRRARGTHQHDALSKSEIVRSIANRFAGPLQEQVISSYVAEFQWLRENGIVEGSKYVANSGERMLEAWRRAMSRF
jgi:hypothetical protein